VANKRDYISALKEAIRNMHGCQASYLRTEHVHESFDGKTVWEGDVEIFRLREHPKAKHAYAWAHPHGANDQQTRFVAILEIPPVKDARTAVQASIAADSK
jgi:hypothetical protein